MKRGVWRTIGGLGFLFVLYRLLGPDGFGEVLGQVGMLAAVLLPAVIWGPRS